MAKPSAQFCFVALFREDGSEIDAPDYARVAMPLSGFRLALTPGGGVHLVNTVDIVFGSTDSDWGRITEFGLYDARRSGRTLLRGRVNVPVDISCAECVHIVAGAMDIQLRQPKGVTDGPC